MESITVEALKEAIAATNELLSPPERIRRFAILSEPFSQENRQLTPTLKVRRRVVEEHYRPLIQQLYQSSVPDGTPVPILAV